MSLLDRRIFSPKALLLYALIFRLALIPFGLDRADELGGRFYDEYGGIAQNLAEGRGFSYAWYGPLRPTSIHAPLYPALLGAVFSLFGAGTQMSAFAVLMLNTALSLLLLWLACAWARSLFGERAARLCLLILAILPTQIYYSVSGVPTVLYALLLLLTLYLTARVRDEPSLRNSVVWGAAIGICAQAYSFVLVIAPLLAVWLWLALGGKAGFVRSLTPVLVGAAAALLLCVPWTLRNHAVHGHWILIRDQAGTNLWWGNSVYASGGVMDREGNRLGTFPDEIADQLRAIPNEVEGDRYLYDLAAREMREDPARTARLWLNKLGYFWWFGTATPGQGALLQRLFPLLKISKLLLLALAGWGLVRSWKTHRDSVVLLLLPMMSLSAVHMVFHAGRIRYFFPLEPILAMLASVAAISLSQRLSRRSPGPSAASS